MPSRRCSRPPGNLPSPNSGLFPSLLQRLGGQRAHGRFQRGVTRDSNLPNPRSARAMQDGVSLALLHFLQQLTDFQCRRRNDLRYRAVSPPLGLRPLPEARHGRRSRQRAACLPGNFFPGRQRRVAKLFAELLGRSFLPFPHFAGVNYHIMRVALSLDLDLAKSDQSSFHISMFRCLDLQGKG